MSASSATALSEGHDELLGRVQELQAKLDSAGDPATRELAEELVSAVVQMYGAGLERIVELVARRGRGGQAPRADARRGGAGGGAPVDPRPAPGATAGAGAGRARAGTPLHGIPRRQRRAARAGGGRRADRPTRQLLELRCLDRHARVRDQAGARGGGPRSGGSRGRGRGGRFHRCSHRPLTPVGRRRLGTRVAACRRHRAADGVVGLSCAAGRCDKRRGKRSPRSGEGHRVGRRGAVRPLQDDGPRGPPPPAESGRAQDRVRVRELLGTALRRCRVPPDRRADAVASGARATRGGVGQLSDSDRTRVPHGARAPPAASSPCTQVLVARPRASCTSPRGAGWSSSIRSWPISSPTSRR